MQTYIQQLLSDISYATENVTLPFTEKEWDIYDWTSNEEENKFAPVRNLQEWTGIKQEILPPAVMLNDEQVERVLQALIKMLGTYNWCFVMQIEVPQRIQYETIHLNFNQPAKMKRWHMGFFAVCKAGTELKKCTLGQYCHCALFDELFSDFTDEELTPEEERSRELEMEIVYLKKKHGGGWMKYYPYHLDLNYDDENGNPYNYGFDDEDINDRLWR